ncbi:hypothetical protein WJ972_21890 [Achromobacter insuavis]
MGAWLAIRHADRHGYVDGQGRWQIAPGAVPGTRFQGKPARALVSGEDGARLIDEHGKTVAGLPAGDWYWPTGSAWLLRADADAAGNPVTVYTDTTGKTRLTLPGTATSFSEGQAAVVLPNGNMRAVNERAWRPDRRSATSARAAMAWRRSWSATATATPTARAGWRSRRSTCGPRRLPTSAPWCRRGISR